MKNVRCIFYATLQYWKASSVSDALKSCLRSSYQMCSIIKGVLTNFAKFTGKHPCQSLFLNKVAVPFLQNTSYCLRICWPTFLTVSIVSSFEKRINPLLPSVTFLYPLAVFGSLHTKNEVSHEGFFRKCDQIRSFLRIWSHLLKKSLSKNFIFCAVDVFRGIEM